MEQEMKNHYLYINKNEGGDIKINYSDGVFGGAVAACKEDFLKYCDEKADMWLNSTFGNFEGWTKEDRKAIAHKWIIAKKLSEGKYDYYFNFGSKEDIFREEVADLAKNMGITYNLTVE
jgi:hypothetical protein